MSILNVEHLTHGFGDRAIFNDVSFRLLKGEHIGLVGANGEGKSTFMNIVTGKLMPDEGKVEWAKNVRVGYLDQHSTLTKGMTIESVLKSAFAWLFELEENMNQICDRLGEAAPDEMDAMMEELGVIQDTLTMHDFYIIDTKVEEVARALGLLELGLSHDVTDLSGGQRMKVLLAKLLLEKPDILLLDEPTNFLDVEHIDWLTKYLNSLDKTFMVISHDTDFLNGVCKYVVSIENGSIRKYTGNYDQFLVAHEMAVKQYAEDYNRQQAEIKKMQDYIDRNKARAATAGMANSRKKMLDRIEVMEKPTAALEAHFDFPCVLLNTKDMLNVRDLEVGYDHVLLPPINFNMRGNTKLWVRGANGIGKSTMLKTLMGVIPRLGGDYRFHIAAKPAYLEQDPEFRNKAMTPYDYISDCFPRMGAKEIRTQLSRVGIRGEMALRHVSDMSGGEQVRIRVLTIMNVTSNMLILDEPTNHLDVNAKRVLTEALQKYEGAILLVSHEKQFAEAVCDDVLALKEL